MSHSLIQADAQQPALFSSAVMPDSHFAESERHGEFTAERLFQRRPDIYKAVVQLLAEKRGQIWIGKLLSVSPSTVRAVAEREGLSVGIAKAALAAEAFGGAQLAMEVVNQKLTDPSVVKDLHPLDAAKIGGILADKALVLSGEANVIVEEKRASAPAHDDFNEYLASLKPAGMGLAGKNARPIETASTVEVWAEVDRRTDPPAVPGESAPASKTDAESEVQTQSDPINTEPTQ